MADAWVQFHGLERFDLESIQTSTEKEFVLALKDHPQVGELHRITIDGRKIDSAEVHAGGRTIGLHDVYVTSMTISGDLWSVTVQADRVEYV